MNDLAEKTSVESLLEAQVVMMGLPIVSIFIFLSFEILSINTICPLINFEHTYVE